MQQHLCTTNINTWAAKKYGDNGTSCHAIIACTGWVRSCTEHNPMVNVTTWSLSVIRTYSFLCLDTEPFIILWVKVIVYCLLIQGQAYTSNKRHILIPARKTTRFQLSNMSGFYTKNSLPHLYAEGERSINFLPSYKPLSKLAVVQAVDYLSKN